MTSRSRNEIAALCLMVPFLFVCAATRGEAQDASADLLGAMKPPEIIASLVQAASGFTNQADNKMAQYSIVQRHLDQYVVVMGSNLTVQSIAFILDQTKQNAILQANVFFWFHQSGALKGLDAQGRLAAYRAIEKSVKQSEGEAFQVGIGLLRRLLEPEGVNAAGSADEARSAAAAIVRMTGERLSQGVQSDKDEAVVRSVLEDVRRLRKRNTLEEKAYTDLLQSCVTNPLLRGGIRVRTAALLFQDSTNSIEVIRVLRAEAENPRNDETLRKDFGALLNKGKP